MSKISEDYIRGLEAESLRYDVSIEDDFVVSVLPNGIKTWAFVYEYQNRPRRKTLGIFPEMSLVQARSALANARAMVARLGAPDAGPGSPADGASDSLAQTGTRPAILASGSRRRRMETVPPAPREPARWPRYLAVGVVGAAAVAAAVFALTRLEWDRESGTTSTDTPASTEAPAAGDGQRRAPASNPFSLSNQPEAEQDSAPEEDAPPPASDDEPRGETGSTDPAPAATPPEDSAIVVAAADSAPASAPDVVDERDAADEAADVVATDTGYAPSEADDRSARVSPVPEGATATGGSVARAVITSAVAELEPRDDLGDYVDLRDSGFRSVFFFTELRNFSDGNVIHRWEHDGRVLADVPLRVKKSWRWRTYSSKDLLPGMTGDWSVSVIDARGHVLASRSFVFGAEAGGTGRRAYLSDQIAYSEPPGSAK